MASIQGVYLALFGRPADPIGLSFFNGVTNNGQNLTAIGDLATTQEYKDRFVGQSTTQIITSIYQSLFNRDPDLAGLTFFATALTNGFITGANGVRIPVNVNNIAILIFDGAQGADVTIRDTKVAAANSFTAGLDTVNEINGYAGNDAAAAGRAFIATVTTTAPTQAQIDAAIVSATTGTQINGQTFTLTNATITGIGDQFKGGAANDLFNGNTPGSLNTGDLLDGGAGIDSLQATLGASANFQPTLTSIERIFTGVVNGAAGLPVTAVLDLSKSSGYKELWTTTTGGNNDITYNSVAADTIIGLQSVGRGGTGEAVDIIVNGAAVDATADIVLDSVGGGTAGARPNLTLNTGATTVNITSQGAGNSRLNSIDVNNLAGTADTMNKLVISGDKAVRIDNAITFNASDTKGEVDATKASGGVNLNLTQVGKDITATGGAGADRFNLGATLTVADKLDGGAGRDTLAVATEAQIVTGLQAANFETLELTGALGGTLIASRVVGVDSVTLGSGSTGIIQGLKSGATVKYTAAATTTDIQLTDATKAGTADTLNLVLEHAGANQNAGVITAAGVETIAISSVKDAATSADAVNTVALVSAQVETITATGTQALNLGTINNTVKVIDGSGLSTANANLQVTVATGNAAQGVAITGGAGADNLVGGDGADIIIGGAGDDRLEGDQGVVVVPQAQVSTFNATGAVDVGDQFSFTVNGTQVSYTATVATTDNVEAGLAAAINGNAIITAQGISAAVVGNELRITGPANGAPVTIANYTATNAVARGEINTINLGATVFDAGDVIKVTIETQTITANIAVDSTVTAAASTLATAIGANATLAAAGYTAAVDGTGQVVVTGPAGINYGISATTVTDQAATQEVETVDFAGNLAAGGIVTVNVAGQSIQYQNTSGATQTDTVYGTAILNLINANPALAAAGVTATAGGDASIVLVNGPANGSEVTAAGISQTNSASPITVSFVGGGVAAATVTETTQGDFTRTNNGLSSLTENQASNPVGPNANSNAAFTLTTVPGVLAVGGAAAADTLTGGDGKDVFVFNTGSGTPGATITNIDTITDLNLGSAAAAGRVDSIDINFGVGALVNAGVATAMTGAATLTAAVNALFGAGGALFGQANTAGLFTYGADTYFVAQNNAGGVFGADDVIIRVTGVTGTFDLSDIV